MTELSFIVFIESICRRPGMYTRGTLLETIAFIDGFRYGNTTPISGYTFDRYVCILYSFPDNYTWGSVIDLVKKDDKDGFHKTEEVVKSFLTLKNRMSDEQVLLFARQNATPESAAANVFRQFETALFSNDENRIRKLIKTHKNASVLWRESYPNGVNEKLQQISASSPIATLPTDKDTKVKIVAHGWPFPVEVEYVDDKWIVNAANIIEVWMKRDDEV